jgi:hypothetical protein
MMSGRERSSTRPAIAHEEADADDLEALIEGFLEDR